MKIKIISIGKVKERYIQQGISEFLKRIGRFSSIEPVVIKDSMPKKETQAILDKLNAEFVIALDANGKQFSSVELAEFIRKNEKNIAIIIGNEDGLADEVKKKANLTLSLSRMTFTHEMAQLFFLEQLYRAFSIIKNTGYHR